MGHIIHFKYQKEELYGWDTSIRHLITLEEFKNRLREDKAVDASRITIVVSEDTDKNTISLKYYEFKKLSVKPKKSKNNKLHLVVDKLHYIILTVNKNTGDFSLYTKLKSGKNKPTIRIRKNIFYKTETNKIDFLNFIIKDNNEQRKALEIFYQKLGVIDVEFDNINDVFSYFNYTDSEIVVNSNHYHEVLSTFVFLNYLKQKNINFFHKHLFFCFKSIFRRNKKEYYNKTITDLIKREFEINDDAFINVVLKYVIKKSIQESLLVLNATSPQTISINKNKIKLLYNFYIRNNYTSYCLSDYLLSTLIESYDQYSLLNVHNCHYILYKNIFNKHVKDSVEYVYLINYLGNNYDRLVLFYMFNFFGVSFKNLSIYDFVNGKLYEIYYKILFLLIDSVNLTGSFIIQKDFYYKICKKSPNYKVIPSTHIRFKYSYPGAYYGADERHISLSVFDIQLIFKNGDNTIEKSIILNPINLSCYINNNQIGGHNDKTTSKIHDIMINYNSDTPIIKMIYSKEYFLNLCFKNNINFDEYFEFSELI